ncbi:PAS domain-containing protein [sulfur-oxidizing endosymbiont of Gigantopelta aegis]|uniref:PAS domain-containing protein n=1 Tax=sulfur-oxidizing endosymbiont of Gigantopelta aegis TaxID=2794934 RepID=UPI003CCCA8FC
MHDMKTDDLPGDQYQEAHLKYHDGQERDVLFTDIETEFPDGCLIVSRTDLNGVITHVNKSFVTMSGFEEDELIGQAHYILRHPEMPPAAFGDLWKTVSNKEKWHGYVKNLRKDGGFYWVYATVIPNIREGKIISYTSVRRKPSAKKVAECIKLYPTLF